MKASQDQKLKKVIGVRALAANAVNICVGAGIFALPAVVALYLGSAGFLAYLFCGLLMAMVLLCFIEVGSKLPFSGGAYTYIETAFGPYVGFLANSLYWFGYSVMSDAAVANVLSDNLSSFFPAMREPAVRTFFMAVVFGGLSLLNVRGTKQGNALVEMVTLAKLLPLLVLILVGIFFIDTANYTVDEWPTLEQVGEISLILFFAFGGAETALSASGEIKNPKRTIPRGILLGLFTVFTFYILIQFVAQGVLGDNLAKYQAAPLAMVAQTIMGDFGKGLIVVGVVISCFGVLSGDILNSSRLPYAAARDGLLPKFLSTIHPRYATPYAAILLYGGVGFILSVSGGFRQLAILSSAALLIIYFGVVLATLKMRKVKPAEHSFVIPGGVMIPLFALLATGWFLSSLALSEIIGVLLFLALFTTVYFAMKWLKR